MKINIENCVAQIGKDDGFDEGRIHAIGEMVGHLKWLRDRLINADYTAIDEFFAIYQFSDNVKFHKALPPGTETGEEWGETIKQCGCLPTEMCACEQLCLGCSARDEEIAKLIHERDQYDARRRELVETYEKRRAEFQDAKNRIDTKKQDQDVNEMIQAFKELQECKE
ncbi:MAG: hypothetical protein GY841_15700 [FCB group bacterium]|nr:hypothetical protein [FCB group bacterium]